MHNGRADPISRPVPPRTPVLAEGIAGWLSEVKEGGGIFTKGMVVLWTKTLAEIPVGWQLADGTNGTPDMRWIFVKGAGEEDEINRLVHFTTALPPRMTVSIEGEHTHEASTSSEIVVPRGQSVPHVATGVNVSTAVGLNLIGTGNGYMYTQGGATPVGESTTEHTHEVTNSTSGRHSHSIEGGDPETAPTHKMFYWIAFVGV